MIREWESGQLIPKFSLSLCHLHPTLPFPLHAMPSFSPLPIICSTTAQHLGHVIGTSKDHVIHNQNADNLTWPMMGFLTTSPFLSPTTSSTWLLSSPHDPCVHCSTLITRCQRPPYLTLQAVQNHHTFTPSNQDHPAIGLDSHPSLAIRPSKAT